MPTDRDWLDSHEFFDVCQAYRHAGDPPIDPRLPGPAVAFEYLKEFIRAKTARRCLCEFSSGGVWAKACRFHSDLADKAKANKPESDSA